MGFSLETSLPVMTVFLQGLLSFFSPCVLPLLPMYISYLSGADALWMQTAQSITNKGGFY